MEQGDDVLYAESVSIRVALPQSNTTAVNEAVTGFSICSEILLFLATNLGQMSQVR